MVHQVIGSIPLYNLPEFRVLSNEGIEEIYWTALRVLQRTGVQVFNDEAVSLLQEAGCDIFGDHRVLIPPHVVEVALKNAPSRVTLYSRDGEPAIHLEGRRTYFGTYGTAPYTYDYYTGERKKTTKNHMGIHARVCDYLPHIDWAMPMGVPSDTTYTAADRHQFQAAVTNLRKPLIASAYSRAGLADIIDMAMTVRGGLEELRRYPFFSTPIDPTSPFRFDDVAIQKLLLMAEKGLPLIFNPMPMCGGNAPITMAGLLVQTAVENLGLLVITQLKRKGTPVIMGGVFSILDMATGAISYGAPELALMMPAWAQLARYWQIPMYGTAGCSNAKTPDEQAAIESTLSILTSAQSGCHLVHDIGIVDAAMTVSMEALVMCDEIIGMVKRIMEGIAINEVTVAVEVFQEVGPGGNFLEHDHTLEHFRDHWRPTLMDRSNYEAWNKAGAKTMGDRIKEKTLRIIETHFPDPLPEDVQQELERIVSRAEQQARALEAEKLG